MWTFYCPIVQIYAQILSGSFATANLPKSFIFSVVYSTGAPLISLYSQCCLIHSGYFHSASSSPLLLRGAPDYSIDTVLELTGRSTTGNCELRTCPRSLRDGWSGILICDQCKAPNLPLSHHHAPQHSQNKTGFVGCTEKFFFRDLQDCLTAADC